MIISASRRTDIPALYLPWLLNRLQDGYVLVRNPYRAHHISRISLARDVLDGLVLWTKNPAPLIDHIDALKTWPYYVQYTLTPYGEALEPGLPPVAERMALLAQLSQAIGPGRIVWRYDPIIITGQYPLPWHIARFEAMAGRIAPLVRKCTISFVDLYASTCRNLDVRAVSQQEMHALAAAFADIARPLGLAIDTCCESIDLSPCGIGHAACVDKRILEEAGGFALDIGSAAGQRSGCGCHESIDIGQYHTCTNGCRYCYANAGAGAAAANHALHDPQSPLLIGWPQAQDVITERKAISARRHQLSMFD